MSTNIIKIDPLNPDPQLIARAGRTIRGGGIVGFPTETVYGLAADAFNIDAVWRIFEVKGRPEHKPLPVQIASLDDITRLTTDIPEVARKLIDRFFPGPLTIILHAAKEVPEIVTAGTGKIGIRMPAHPVALAMILAAGTPIVAPSANPSDLPPPTTADEVAAYFNGRVDLILDAGPSQIKTASTVLDMTQTPPRILRQGTVTQEEIMRLVSSK